MNFCLQVFIIFHYFLFKFSLFENLKNKKLPCCWPAQRWERQGGKGLTTLYLNPSSGSHLMFIKPMEIQLCNIGQISLFHQTTNSWIVAEVQVYHKNMFFKTKNYNPPRISLGVILKRCLISTIDNWPLTSTSTSTSTIDNWPLTPTGYQQLLMLP